MRTPVHVYAWVRGHCVSYSVTLYLVPEMESPTEPGTTWLPVSPTHPPASALTVLGLQL